MLHMAVNATEFGLMFKTDRHRYIERYSNFNKRSIFLILLNYFLRSEAAFKILTIRHEKELKVAYNLVWNVCPNPLNCTAFFLLLCFSWDDRPSNEMSNELNCSKK